MSIQKQRDEEELLKLRLTQARRREWPFHMFKGVFIFALVATAIGVVLAQFGCSGTQPERQITKVEQKKNVDALWGGDAAAHKRRLP